MKTLNRHIILCVSLVFMAGITGQTQNTPGWFKLMDGQRQAISELLHQPAIGQNDLGINHPSVPDLSRFYHAQFIPPKIQRLDSLLVDEYDEITGLVNYGEKLAFEYDEQNRNISYSIYQRAYQEDSWTGELKVSYEFDAFDRKALERIYIWESESWQQIYILEYNYVAPYQWNVISYSFENGMRVPEWKDVYLLDMLERIEAFYSYEWETDNTWQPRERTLFNYSNKDELFQVRYGYWDMEKAAYLDYFMTEYHYSPNGLLLEEWFVDIDPFSGNFFTSEKTLYTYDLYNKKTSTTSVVWDDMATTWAPTNRTMISYDLNDNIDSQLEQYWDTDLQSWIDEYRSILEYDNNYERSDILLPGILTEEFLEDDSWFNHKLLTISGTYWEAVNEIWLPAYSGQLFYSDQATSIAALLRNSFEVYPTPADDHFIIQAEHYGELALIDMQGNVVQYLDLPDAESRFSTDGLANGIYILRWNTTQQSYNQRIIILHGQ